MSAKRVTIIDIANELGVSTATVNRALTGKGRISAKTQKLVIEKANALGYTPNLYAKALSSREPTNIAIICPSDCYFIDVLDGMEGYCNEHPDNNIQLSYKHTETFDVSLQIQQINECITEKVDGVLLAASHPILLNSALQTLTDAGIPVVTFNNDAPDSARCAYIGQNCSVAGRMAAELMCKFLRGQGVVAVMASLAAGYDLRMRTKSFCSYLQQNAPKIKLVGTFEYMDSDDASYHRAKEVFQNLKIDGIYANNMFGTIGMARAAAELKPPSSLIMVGNDLDREIANQIEADIIDAVIFQNPYSQGYYALKLILQILHSHVNLQSKKFYTKSSVVMKSNIMEKGRWNRGYYYSADGVKAQEPRQ